MTRAQRKQARADAALEGFLRICRVRDKPAKPIQDIGTFDKWVFPIIKNCAPELITSDILSIEPAPLPKGFKGIPLRVIHPRPTHHVTGTTPWAGTLLPDCPQEIVKGSLARFHHSIEGMPIPNRQRAALRAWQQKNKGCVFVYYYDIQPLSGRAGYAAIRDDKVVDFYLHLVS